MRKPARHLTAERGYALPVSLAMLFIIGTLAAVTTTSAITANSQSGRDRNTKRALAAADSGVRAAVYRINVMQPGTQCVTQNASSGALTTEAPQSDGWCRPQTEDLGGGASYSYRVSSPTSVTLNGQQLVQRKIVSIGNVNGIKRRIVFTVNASTGKPLFMSGYAAVGLEQFEVPNNVLIDGSAASNGNIYLRNFGKICGNATPGPGKQVIIENSGQLCAGFSDQPTSSPVVFDPVDPGNSATQNDNGRIGTQDPWSSPSKIEWNPATRSLVLNSNATLTLGGNIYSFCYLEIANNAQLIIAKRDPNVAVRIYIDSPEHCGGGPGAGSVKLTNSASILNLNSDPTTLQLYVIGSASVATSVDFENIFHAALNMVIYAPQSTVAFMNNAEIVGAVAAKRLTLQNSSRITWSDSVAKLTSSSLLPIFHREAWQECTPESSGSAPDSGC